MAIRQLIYTSYDDPQSGHGGWQVKQRTSEDPGLDYVAQLMPQVPRLQPVREEPVIMTAETRAHLDTRLSLVGVPGGELALSQEVPAGADASGRSGNTFTHALVGSPSDFLEQMEIPLDAYRATGWLTPHGLQEVADAWVNPSIMLFPNMMDLDLDRLLAPGSGLEQLVTATQETVRARRSGCPRTLVVLAAEDPRDALPWLAAIQRLCLPADAWQIAFSTLERLTGPAHCRNLLATGFDVVIVPMADQPHDTEEMTVFFVRDGILEREGEDIVSDPTSWGSFLSTLRSLSKADVAATVESLATLLPETFTEASADPAWGLAILTLELMQREETVHPQMLEISKYVVLHQPRGLDDLPLSRPLRVCDCACDTLQDGLQQGSIDLGGIGALTETGTQSEVFQQIVADRYSVFLDNPAAIGASAIDEFRQLPAAAYSRTTFAPTTPPSRPNVDHDLTVLALWDRLGIGTIVPPETAHSLCARLSQEMIVTAPTPHATAPGDVRGGLRLQAPGTAAMELVDTMSVPTLALVAESMAKAMDNRVRVPATPPALLAHLSPHHPLFAMEYTLRQAVEPLPAGATPVSYERYLCDADNLRQIDPAFLQRLVDAAPTLDALVMAYRHASRTTRNDPTLLQAYKTLAQILGHALLSRPNEFATQLTDPKTEAVVINDRSLAALHACTHVTASTMSRYATPPSDGLLMAAIITATFTESAPALSPQMLQEARSCALFLMRTFPTYVRTSASGYLGDEVIARILVHQFISTQSMIAPTRERNWSDMVQWIAHRVDLHGLARSALRERTRWLPRRTSAEAAANKYFGEYCESYLRHQDKGAIKNAKNDFGAFIANLKKEGQQ